MLKGLLASVIAILLAATAVAAFSRVDRVGTGNDPIDATEEEKEELEAEDGGMPPDVEALVEANQAHAAARAQAAHDHAAAIMAWTACIADNAANAPIPRDDTFDPKLGPIPCGDKPTPPTDPNDPEVEVEVDGGPPDAAGLPEGAGPPDWVPGPPPGAGPGSERDEDGTEAP